MTDIYVIDVVEDEVGIDVLVEDEANVPSIAIPGPPGPMPELRVNDGVLQWRPVKLTPAAWTDLLDLGGYLTASEVARAAAEAARDLSEEYKFAAEDAAVLVTNAVSLAEEYRDDAIAARNAAEEAAGGAAVDRVQTGLDRVATGADAIATAADRVTTAADRVATGQDKAATAADRVQTGLDREATNADRTQTDLDKAATAADRAQTGLDRLATADDVVATGQDRIATAADRVQTGLDKAATNVDRVQTGLDRIAATESAALAATFDPNSYYNKSVSDSRFATAAQGAKADTAVQPAGLAAKADLVGGVIPESQLPALAITDTFEVATQAAMLALTAQRGDVAVRSDLGKSFILKSTPASTLANWVELRTPIGAVLSVAGKTGAVTLAKGDVGLGNVDNTSDASKPVSTATQTALNGKADLVEGKVPESQLPAAGVAYATKAQAEAGVAEGVAMDPLRTAQAIAALAGGVVVEVFTASGTFTKQEDDLAYFVECIGGGASGNATGANAQIRGGGGGMYDCALILPGQIASVVSIVVGAGGLPSTSAVNNAGGDSWFSTFCIGQGGDLHHAGGLVGPASLSGYNGGNGGYSTSSRGGGDSVRGGAGGACSGGGVGGVSTFAGNGGDDVNINGQIPGGGGANQFGGGASGAGARGEVRVYRFKRIKQ